MSIDGPIVDHGLLRQAQTAGATESLAQQRGLAMSSRIPWAGDLDERFVQELPIYNYLVIGANRLIGRLDPSAKLVSVSLWALSFVLLQAVWRRCLTMEQAGWANVLFILSPLGVFYAQAFMPEMLMQVLVVGFVLLLVRYDESPTLGRWLACTGVGLIGLLVKAPEVSHLYIVLAAVVLRREGSNALRRPRYWIAAVITVAALKGWVDYMDAVNHVSLPEWGGRENLRHFIGTVHDRLQFKPWAMIAFYLGSFVTPGAIAAVAAAGLWLLRRQPGGRVLAWWAASLAFFYLFWAGNTAAVQGYYNLVALIPLCGVFGIGMAALLRRPLFAARHRLASTVAAAMVVLFCIPGIIYLFQRDRSILSAELWVRSQTRPGDVVIFRPNHRWDMMAYPYNAVLAYGSERPVFVWTNSTPARYKAAALERARYAVVTRPQPAPGGLLGALNRFRGNDQRVPESVDWLEASGFRIIVESDLLAVYERIRPRGN